MGIMANLLGYSPQKTSSDKLMWFKRVPHGLAWSLGDDNMYSLRTNVGACVHRDVKIMNRPFEGHFNHSWQVTSLKLIPTHRFYPATISLLLNTKSNSCLSPLRPGNLDCPKHQNLSHSPISGEDIYHECPFCQLLQFHQDRRQENCLIVFCLAASKWMFSLSVTNVLKCWNVTLEAMAFFQI